MKTERWGVIKIKKQKTLFENDSIEILKSRIDKINKKITRLEMQQQRLKQNERAARTRTLIQLGGLLVKSGVVKKLGIEVGTDLQREEDQKKKAYALLGLLVGQVSVSTELEKLEQLGKQFLFENQNDVLDGGMIEISKNLLLD